MELSEAGQAFIMQNFEEFDKDRDGALSPAEQAEMFSTAPDRSACVS